MDRRTFITAFVVGGIVAARRVGCSCRAEDALHVASFNLRNFPSAAHDLPHVADLLADLEVDLLAVQEVRDPDALQAVLPGRDVHLSVAGGSHGQRLGIACDPARVQVLEPPREDDRLALGGRVRPAFVARVATPVGPLSIVVVHLKARAAGLADRRRQWTALHDLLAELADPIVLVGDFNATGGAAERSDLAAVLAPRGIVPIVNTSGCSAYWEGVRHDGWQEPSQLDLAFVSRSAEIGALGAAPMAHCARWACRPFRSTEAHPDRDLHRASDHCPLRFELRHL